MVAQQQAFMGDNVSLGSYWQAFGLSRDPFARAATSESYQMLQWSARLNLMHEAIESNILLLSVLADTNSLKFRPIDFFKSRIEPQCVPCVIRLTSDMDASDILQLIFTKCRVNLETFDNSDIEARCDDLLNELHSSNRQCVVLFEDAEFITEPNLKILLRLIEKQQKSAAWNLKLVLFTKKPFQSTISKLIGDQSASRLARTFNFTDQKLQDTKQYLRYCMRSCGGSRRLPFNRSEVPSR